MGKLSVPRWYPFSTVGVYIISENHNLDGSNTHGSRAYGFCMSSMIRPSRHLKPASCWVSTDEQLKSTPQVVCVCVCVCVCVRLWSCNETSRGLGSIAVSCVAFLPFHRLHKIFGFFCKGLRPINNMAAPARSANGFGTGGPAAVYTHN